MALEIVARASARCGEEDRGDGGTVTGNGSASGFARRPDFGRDAKDYNESRERSELSSHAVRHIPADGCRSRRDPGQAFRGRLSKPPTPENTLVCYAS
jgi:hypothetical protein